MHYTIDFLAQDPQITDFLLQNNRLCNYRTIRYLLLIAGDLKKTVFLITNASCFFFVKPWGGAPRCRGAPPLYTIGAYCGYLV